MGSIRRENDLRLLDKDDDKYGADLITGEVKDLIVQLSSYHKSVSLDLVELNALKEVLF